MKRAQTVLVILLVCSGVCVAASYTNLQEAVIRGDIEQVKQLLESGVAANLQNDLGRTALHYAAVPGGRTLDYSAQIAELILRYGGDPNVIDDVGATPTVIAVATGNQAVVRVLLSYGGDPNVTDPNGLSLLAMAEVRGQASMASLLRAEGARYVGSAGDLKLLPELQNGLEFARRVRLRRERDEDTSFEEIVRQEVLKIWPDASKEDLETVMERAKLATEGCASCSVGRGDEWRAK